MFFVRLANYIDMPAAFSYIIIATYYFKESVNKSFIRVRNAVAALKCFCAGTYYRYGIVQTFAAEDREFKKFNDINKEHRNANVKAIFAYSVFFPAVELILAIIHWLAGMVGSKRCCRLATRQGSRNIRYHYFLSSLS